MGGCLIISEVKGKTNLTLFCDQNSPQRQLQLVKSKLLKALLEMVILNELSGLIILTIPRFLSIIKKNYGVHLSAVVQRQNISASEK